MMIGKPMCVHSDGFEHEAPMDEDGFATTCGAEEEI
jgi:hypothetical protein